MRLPKARVLAALVAVAALAAAGAALATSWTDGETSPGITDTEIKIGGIYPFSGPAAAYGAVAEGARAYFEYVNDRGGVDGRKVRLIALDDGYDPRRAVKHATTLVEHEQVFALFNTLSTESNLAIWDYANREGVPQVYVASGASIFGADAEGHPWTIGWQPSYTAEAATYADFLKRERPRAKVAVLHQDDAFGEDLLGGFERAIAGSGVEIVAREAYGPDSESVTPHVLRLAQSGADTFLNVTTPKFAAQAIGTIAKTPWRPLHILNNISSSTELVLQPAGLANAKGVVSAAFIKVPQDPRWEDDPAMRTYKAAVRKYAPRGTPEELFTAYGWAAAATLVRALDEMDEPTREALMHEVRNMDARIPMLLPGVRVKTGPGDGYPVEDAEIMRFDGKRWRVLGAGDAG